MTAFHQPASLSDALALLARKPEAICLAGGQSLVAAINTGLVQPAMLVDLNHIESLRGISYADDGTLTVGAMTTHAAIADADTLRGAHCLLAETAKRIAHPAIRLRGTMGGSICHADPAADYPAALVALGAEVEIAHESGSRHVAAADFFTGFLSTDLKPSEMVTAIRFPPFTGAAGYDKVARAEGDFATVSLALALDVREGRCLHAGLAVGACGPVPVRSIEAEKQLIEGGLHAASLIEAGQLLTTAADPADDLRGSAAYRRRLIPRLLTRAVKLVTSN